MGKESFVAEKMHYGQSVHLYEDTNKRFVHEFKLNINNKILGYAMILESWFTNNYIP